MAKYDRGLLIGSVGAMLLCAAAAVHAQDNSSNSAIIGPPQLKDFQLEPRERIVTQPAAPPATQRPVELAPPAPVAPASRRPQTQPRQAEPAQSARTAGSAPSVATPATELSATGETPSPAQSSPPLGTELPTPAAEVASPPPAEIVTPSMPPAEEQGWPYWYYALPAAMLAFLGIALVRRRRRGDEEPAATEAPAVAAPPPAARPRVDPVPRPWLELSLKAERAAFNQTETEINFELEIANKGGSAARNLRVDVKMFNAGAEQDKEIGTFFRTAGREGTKLRLPGVEAGVNGLIQGSVGMPREDMRAMRLDERLLFIPVLAVNVLYDWGEGRTGQTSKSYVIGRELEQPSEKMGAFRVDQGPRIWRAVGQRPHKLARRV